MSARSVASLIVLAALGAAVAGAPAPLVQLYAEQVYPALQATLTPLSNRVPVPLFDFALGIAIVGAVVMVGRGVQRAWRTRSPWPLWRRAGVIVVVAAVVYLWFLLAWGYNYRRPGVEQALTQFQADRVTPARVRQLAELAVSRTNQLYADAHGRGFPELDAVPPSLLSSLHGVEQGLGRPRPTEASIPKRPWTAPYMRAVGVSGMLAPLFLETYLNPDLTGPERPYVLAHEWAHLSGYAPEEDASFVGLLTALGADVPAQYSAWLFLVSEATQRLDPVTQDVVLRELGPGPRSDLAAIAVRLRARVPWLDRASWVAYDRAIRSQGAEAGVAGYGRVIELLLGSDALAHEGLAP